MREKLILNNEKLIYAILKKKGLYNQKEDYYDLGMIGLIKAADKFDESKGIAFSSYAYTCILNELNMDLRKANKDKYKANINTLSLNETVFKNDDGNEIKIKDMIPDDMDLEEEMIKKDELDSLYNSISELNEKEQLLINLSYGLNGYNKETQENISKIFELSQAQISRLKDKIIKKLRKNIENSYS